MNITRSPKKTRGSFPDLTKMQDNVNLSEQSQVTVRKRKEPEYDTSLNQEFEKLRNEMRSIYNSFSNMHSENTSKMQQDLQEIKEQLGGIKVSTDKLIEDQNKMKIELENLKITCVKNENSIKNLEKDIQLNKSCQPSSSQSHTSFSYEEVLTEFQDRV